MELLSRISLQLSSFSSNAAFINSTVPALPGESFHASTSIISINVLWFLSLTFSLMAALFAILVQQWIQQYLDFPLVTARERACLRQRRYNGLNRWLVPHIISALSSLLQMALFLFLAGLVTLLWTLDRVVAIAITAAIALFLCGFIITTIMPAFSVD